MAAFQIRSRIIDREAPTPMIMFAVREYGTDYGIAVTASHNPAIYNGIKVFLEGGRDADGEWTGKRASRWAGCITVQSCRNCYNVGRKT